MVTDSYTPAAGFAPDADKTYPHGIDYPEPIMWCHFWVLILTGYVV